MADEREAHGGAVGDTDDVHDRLHPHDLPPGHPTRPAVERELAEAQDEDTDTEPNAAG